MCITLKERFLLHYSDPRNWRLRNVEEHPFDPGWEVGSYSVCHCNIRPLVEAGTRIFDVVVRNQKAILRSAFEVTDVRGRGKSRVLHFDEYYFSDEEPIELQGDYIQYRCMKMETYVKKYDQQHSLWNKVVKEYRKYTKGQRPRSVDAQSWNDMIEETPRTRGCHAENSPSGDRRSKRKCK